MLAAVAVVDTVLQLLKLEEAAGQVAVVLVETELRQAQQLLAQQILAVVVVAALLFSLRFWQAQQAALAS